MTPPPYFTMDDTPDLAGGLLYVGDCLEVMSSLPSGSVDLVFADPPYNLSGKSLQWEGKEMGGNWYKVNEHWDTMPREVYAQFTRAWLAEVGRLLVPRGSLYVCCTYHNLPVVSSSLEDQGWRLNNIITWHKPNAMPSMTRRTFTHSTEFLVYAVRESHWIFNYQELKAINPDRRMDGESRQMRDMWSIPVCQGAERLHLPDGRALHPTQKPEALVLRAVVASSESGHCVLDPFLGSGTTAAVASRLKRRWIGIERDPAFCKATVERLTSRRESSRSALEPSVGEADPGT